MNVAEKGLRINKLEKKTVGTNVIAIACQEGL